MENTIQLLRESMDRDFDPDYIIHDEHVDEVSPCGRYRLSTARYGTAKDPTYPAITVLFVRRQGTDEIVAQWKRNDSREFYSWITVGDHDYLLFPEDLEGQSVIDLTTGRMEGYSTKDGGFIWTQFYPSPDKTKLAIIGCCWACPYEVVVYDFRNPMNLPLPVISEFLLPGNNAQFNGWDSEKSFSLLDDQGVVHEFEILVK